MTTVNVHEAKTHLSKLLQRVEGGETITIARAGKPVAELSAIPKPDIVFGAARGQISFDFEEFQAADDEIWPASYRTGEAPA